MVAEKKRSFEDLLVAVQEAATAGDKKAEQIRAKLVRKSYRVRSLRSAIADLPERSERPTIPEAKRAAYARTLEECRVELPMVEAELAHWTQRAEQFVAQIEEG